MKYQFINLDYLFKHSNGKREIEKQMLEIYQKELPKLLNKMKTGLAEENWHKAGQAAYRARNILPTIGLIDISNDLDELDQLCRQKVNLEKVNEIIARFELMIPELLNEVNSALTNYTDIQLY